MPSLRDYFETDIRGVSSVEEERQAVNNERGLHLKARVRVYLDFNAYVKYISYYLVDTNDVVEACVALMQNPEWALYAADGLKEQPRLVVGQQPHSKDLPFSRRMLIYCEQELTDGQIALLDAKAKELNLFLEVRGPQYARARAAEERAVAFICHDSRDKEEIAKPLAVELGHRMCPVWFDEYSLRPGASLRQSIERGIKECSKCVLIVSANFISNAGWTKVEFNSIFTREVLEKSSFVLPVWVNVSAREVYEYSPSLADKVAVPWSLGAKEVARVLAVEILSSSDDPSAYHKFAPVVGPR